MILFLRPLAERFKLVDQPSGRKIHVGAIPLVGGIAIFVTLLFLAMLLGFKPQTYTLTFMTSLAILVIMGAADDREELHALGRMIGQIFVSLLAVIFAGIKITSFGNILGFGVVNLGYASGIVTILAIVLFINATNMLDGSDGLAGSIALVQLIFLTVMTLGESSVVTEKLIILCLIGSILAFLYFNFPWRAEKSALVFLGDAGSMILGFAIIWFCIQFSQSPLSIIKPVTVLWITSVTLYDFFTVFIRRIKKRSSPLHADRTHLHHILYDLKLSRMQIVMTIAFSNLLLGILGIILSHYSEFVSFITFVAIFVGYFVGTSFLIKSVKKGII